MNKKPFGFQMNLINEKPKESFPEGLGKSPGRPTTGGFLTWEADSSPACPAEGLRGLATNPCVLVIRPKRS